MTIYDALEKDHEKIESLLDQLVSSAQSDSDEWKSLVDRIADELVPHARAEEALFYNPIRDSAQGKSLISHSYAEHARAESELRSLQARESVDAEWTRLAKKLRDDLLRHVETEETEVFDVAKKIFSENDAIQIGEAFDALKSIVRKQTFVGPGYDLVVDLVPKRMREGIKTQLSQLKKSA
jgi:hemerythrin superfamily protein